MKLSLNTQESTKLRLEAIRNRAEFLSLHTSLDSFALLSNTNDAPKEGGGTIHRNPLQLGTKIPKLVPAPVLLKQGGHNAL